MFDLKDFSVDSTIHLDNAYADSSRVIDLATATLTLDQVRLSRLVGRGCQTMHDHSDSNAVLSLQLVSDQENSVSDWFDPVWVNGSFGTIEFAQGSRFLRGLTGIDISAERNANATRWTWLQAALLGHLRDTPLACVRQLAFTGRHDTDDLSVLRVTLQSGSHTFSTTARANAAAWLHFIDQTSWEHAHRPLSTYAELQSQIVVPLARHTMPAHILATLSAGDIILPSHPNFMCNGEGNIRWGTLIARVRYEAPSAIIITALEGNMDLQESDMDTMQDHYQDDGSSKIVSSHQDDAGAALDSLPVELSFELGKANLSFKELRNIGIGTVVLLDGGSSAFLSIVSGKHILGRGEAVEVNGQLGIRITHWGAEQ
ncbi:FliM/FliN family flagellar motor switch protein [Undibacterium sp. SXout7W]|uniref:FliM/FliN family flagellar motor switch protein n=1 Tax=Undibacterium sp. SXout7W TaxID=3413049 RepID=UPI003BF103FA